MLGFVACACFPILYNMYIASFCKQEEKKKKKNGTEGREGNRKVGKVCLAHLYLSSLSSIYLSHISPILTLLSP